MQVVIIQKGVFNLQTHIGQAKQIVINECVISSKSADNTVRRINMDYETIYMIGNGTSNS